MIKDISIANQILKSPNTFDPSQFTPLQIKNKRLFMRRQKELLMIANSEEGRAIMGIKHDYPVVLVVPNGHHYLVNFDNGNPVIQADLYTWERNAKLLLPILTKIDIIRDSKYRPESERMYFEAVRHYAGLEKSRRMPEVFLASDDYYTGGGDGYVRQNSQGTNWGACVAAGSGDGTDIAGVGSEFGPTRTDHYWLYRLFFPTDTSSILDNAVISANIFHLWVHSRTVEVTNDTYGRGGLFSASQASPTALANSDYTAVGATEIATNNILFRTVSLTAYFDYTFNGTGLALISKTTFTLISGRSLFDSSNQDPGLGGDQHNLVSIRNADQTGTSNDPYMTVTYTIPSSPAFFD